MRRLYILLPVLLALSASSAPLSAQVVDIGRAERDGEGRMAVAVQSADPTLDKIARRAFSLHGAYTLTTEANASFQIRIEPAGNDSILLTIGSGQPYVEQLRRTVPGRDRQDAALRALDLAVEATGHKLGLKGFFAGKLAFVGKQRGNPEIYTSDMLFSRVRPLTAERALVTGPSWSPDGTKLLYTSYHKTGFPDIYLIDLRSGKRVPVATFKGTNTGGKFSPDGRRIAMTLSGTGNSELYVSNAEGRNIRRLTTNRSLEASPSWSPDGKRLVYTSDAPGRPQLFEISANGGAGRRIPTDISGYCSEPAWNPRKAHQIAFTAAVGGGFQIALYDSKTRRSEILTSVTDAAVEPAWMNDGRHLVFTERKGGRTRLMLLDTLTKKISPLHNPNFGDASSASFVY